MVFQDLNWERRRFEAETEPDEDWRYARQYPYRERYRRVPLGFSRRGRYEEYDTSRDYEEGWWQEPWPFTGVGPRGYRRSDEALLDDVYHRMEEHGALDASEITIGAQDGIITLTGFIDTRAAKRLAEDIALSVPGVLDVDNHLWVIGMHAARRLRDEVDTRAAGEALERDQPGYLRIHPGMQVFGSDGQFIGNVKGVRREDFLVDIPLARDVYVPFSACNSTTGNEVWLDVASDELGNQGWEQPPLLGGEASETDTQASD